MSSIWVRIMHNTYGRMAVAGVAALLALSIWRSGTLDIILDRSSQLDVWTPPAQSQSLPDGPKHPDPMAQLYDKFTGALDGLWGRGKGPDAQTRPPAAMTNLKTNLRGKYTMKKRNPDFDLFLHPGRWSDVPRLYEAGPVAGEHVLSDHLLWDAAPPLTITCLIVWMYSFLIPSTCGQRSAPAMPPGRLPDPYRLVRPADAAAPLRGHKLLGWGLIATGVLIAYQQVVMGVLDQLMWAVGTTALRSGHFT